MIKKGLEYLINSCYHIIKIGAKNEGGIMKNRVSAMDVANWFLWYNEVQQNRYSVNSDNYDVYEGLTHLKIQKLLYFADGVNLAVNGTPLFKEKIYAWPHGPVVREVYEKLSCNGREEIKFTEDNFSKIQEMNENNDLYDLLVSVYNSYAGYTAWQLREKSHVVGGPWQVTVDTKGMQKEIDRELIKNYFKTIVKIENE